MTTTSVKTNSRQMLFAAVALIALSAPSMSIAFSGDSEGNCSFSRQLENPADRADFVAQVKAARDAATSRFGEFQLDSPKLVFSGGQQIQIDSFSFNCVSCHDGTNASSHDLRFKNAQDYDVSADAGPLASHPIGMHYGDASYGNKHLKPPQDVHPDMLFVDGMVGCLSCHNPLNPKKYHLVLDNERSNLCFSCHSI